MDQELCQLDQMYVHALANYNRVLMQRNKLLKDLSFRPDYQDTLGVWDEQLTAYGSQVIRSREGFTQRLNEVIHDIHCSNNPILLPFLFQGSYLYYFQIGNEDQQTLTLSPITLLLFHYIRLL